MTALSWLPELQDFRPRLNALGDAPDPWTAAIALANHRLDFLQTNALAARLSGLFPVPPAGVDGNPARLAVLGTSTTTHLLPAIRVGALRHGMWAETFESDYGQYYQAVVDPGSACHRFAPNVVLFAFDAHNLTQGVHPGLSAAEADAIIAGRLDHLCECWQFVRSSFRCPVIQQTGLPILPALLGNNEHRLPGSPRHALARLNTMLRERAGTEGVLLLALDERAAQDGIVAWHDPALWCRSRMEIVPSATPLYGDMVARMLGPLRGRTHKCLVLDLDNTIWGGVIGDDGLDGIALGQGSALGEGYLAVQAYAKALAARGIILAVCSKNEERTALEAFDKHPEMLLRRADIACFQANWDDKATNLRAIAKTLNIGLDALVLLDDNPAERALVRQELPMVAVPEIPDDPARVPGRLAESGYFEALSITVEDRTRTALYQRENARSALRERTTDMATFLRGMEMRLYARRFDETGIARITQLINKTNQFNLTTRRYTEEAVRDIMQAPDGFGLYLRLVDRFGDNGIIAVIIGRMQDGEALRIDTWLMSCRVLGRQVEDATLNLIVVEARNIGAQTLIGDYVPTAKNAMVRDHYARLGFTPEAEQADGRSRFGLDLADFRPIQTFITMDSARDDQ